MSYEIPKSAPADSDPKETQEWLDQKREQGYLELSKFLNDKREQGGMDSLRDMIADSYNGALEKAGRERVDYSELLENVDFIEAVSPSASAIADVEIKRPVFVFESLEDFQAFYAATYGETQDGEVVCAQSSALVNSLDFTLEDSGEKVHVGLIIGSPDGESIGHEIRHSIDPHVFERTGYDKMLAELFANYWEMHLQEAHPDKTEDDKWNRLRAAIWSAEESYYSNYSKGMDDPLTYKEYGALTGKVIEATRVIQEHNGDHVETQRQICQLTSLDELFALAEDCKTREDFLITPTPKYT